MALSYIDPTYKLTGLDINGGALSKLKQLFAQKEKDCPEMVQGSFSDYEPIEQYDMVFTKGVLIHIAPEMLPAVYDKMVAMSSRYVMVAEYYNPTPVELNYRGHTGKLYKRDFAGEIMDRHNLRLAGYGFVYHRDLYPQDDLAWFLLEKV
jgi:pseudaminic acid biosynthesis-associated methylase